MRWMRSCPVFTQVVMPTHLPYYVSFFQETFRFEILFVVDLGFSTHAIEKPEIDSLFSPWV
jgi:hypothetical protein